MTPTQFKEAVEDILIAVQSYKKDGHAKGNRAEASAAIQTATAELIEGLVGEDDPEALQSYRTTYYTKAKAKARNRLRHELRQKAKELKQ